MDIKTEWFLAVFWSFTTGIGFLNYVGLDISFLTTLILSLFVILLSFFFYKESSAIYGEIKKLLWDLKSEIMQLKKMTQKNIEDLKTSTTLNKDKEIKNDYERTKD